MAIETKCLNCGIELLINGGEGDGYFLGYDTQYYGDREPKDPHEIVGYFCGRCGSFLRAKATEIGWTIT